ncbi:MAG: glycosyltransferase family 4 protein [Deltaproteobacteria bacterium]|nr:MAG: glycosyltransferase family 4 protein [Deltaproteobacteria bacterium]
MKVLAIISRDLEKGSTKYRLVQYLDFLAQKDIRIEFVRRKDVNATVIRNASEFNLVFNQKCLFNYSVARKLIMNSHRTIFDFDDAIYTRPSRPHSFITNFKVKRRLHLWLKNSNTVTAPNQFLANYARKFSRSVAIVPMALDMEVWKPRDSDPGSATTIGWAGAPVNLPLIEKLNQVLTTILNKFPTVQLAIFSGKKPKLSCNFEYHPYKPGAEPVFVRNLDIGLLPLYEDEYAKGKSPIKALQYLACGIPVVGNIIGATAEILNDQNSMAVANESEWVKALETLIVNRELAKALGRRGQAQVNKNHNIKIVAQDLYKILTGV